MGRVLDFDQARSERREPATLRAFGREWPIPSQPPVGFILLGTGIASKDEHTLQDRLDLLQAAVGVSVFDHLVAEGLEPDDISTLISLIQSAWSDEDEDGEGDPGEAQAPTPGAG